MHSTFDKLKPVLNQDKKLKVHKFSEIKAQ